MGANGKKFMHTVEGKMMFLHSYSTKKKLSLKMFPVTLYISRRVRVRDNRRNLLHPPASLKYQNLSHEGPVERMRDGFRVASGMDD